MNGRQRRAAFRRMRHAATVDDPIDHQVKPHFFHTIYLLLSAAPSTAKTTNAKTTITAQNAYAKNNGTLPFAMYSQHASDRPTSKSSPPSQTLNRPRIIAIILFMVMDCGSGSPFAVSSGEEGRGAPHTVQTIALLSPVVAHFGQNGIRFNVVTAGPPTRAVEPPSAVVGPRRLTC